MNQRRLGKTDLTVGEIGVGCWAAGGLFNNLGLAGGWSGVDEIKIKEGLISAINMGANMFDTADVYGFGKSERLVGWMLRQAYKQGFEREYFVISNKVGYSSRYYPNPYSPINLEHQLKKSLDNLGTPYLDVYFFHHDYFGANDQYLKPAIEKMREFKKKKLIRFIGLRALHQYLPHKMKEIENKDAKLHRFLRINDIVKPDVIGLKFNMMTTFKDLKFDIFKWAERRGIGIVIFEPLAHGLLSNKYSPTNMFIFDKDDHRIRKAWFTANGISFLKSKLDLLGKRFHCNTNKDFIQLALRYCLSKSKFSCVTVGFKNKNQIIESLSTNGLLDVNEIQYIEDLFSNIEELEKKLI